MTLAIHGGKRLRTNPWPPRPPYGLGERNVANEVVATGQLSGFLGEAGDSFLGGPRVLALEKAWCEKFGVRYAVSMNSATSCLFAAVKALGIGPGDEVIVTPWSMSASASCVLAAGATPVFADIEPQGYGLASDSVSWAITPRTKAIVAVHLFGYPADLDGLHPEIPVIEDAAQAIGASYYGRPVGTIRDIGVYSLNRHKTLQVGEGGMAVTDDLEIAEKLRGYRNHGEALGAMEVGGNYRLGEIEAAIATVQLSRLEELTEPRVRNAKRLTEALSELDGLTPPRIPEELTHAYYLYAVRITEKLPGMFHMALRAEGIPVQRYVEPLYRLPVFGHTAPWQVAQGIRDAHPEVERAHRDVVATDLIHAGMTDEDLDDIIKAFQKVWTHREEL